MKVAKKTLPEKELTLRIHSKQVDLLYSNQYLGLAIIVAVVFLLFAEFKLVLDWDAIGGLALFFVVVMLFRISITLLYFSAKRSKTIHMRRAEFFYLIGVMCTGAFWSITIFSLFPIISLDSQIILIITALIFASGSNATIGYLKMPVYSYILSILVPLAYVINNSDLAAAQTVAFGVFLYLLFMLRAASIFYNNTYDMLYLKELSSNRKDELRLQKEKANTENMGKSKFLSRMSHELRTPLNAILGLSKLQLSELPDMSPERAYAEANIPEKLYLKGEDSIKILLVEDNLVNSEVAVELLTALGIEADVANNGEQALELFDTNEYSLILMDCEMPIMDGFTATKLMREKECESHQDSVPIIALTAHAVSGAREKCLACGMDDFLSKPFNLTGLHLILSQWLKVELTDVLYKVDKVQIPDTTVYQSNADILDSVTLSRLYAKEKECGTDFLNNLVGIYLKQSSQLLDEILMACRKSDVEVVRKNAHTLKSSSANVGALNFSKLCREVELACEQELLDDVLIQDVYQSYPKVEAALKAVLQNIK